MNPISILYKAKKDGKWTEGYPVIKNNKTYLFDAMSYELLEIDEKTLCKKIDEKYFENDVFEYNGYRWTITYEKIINGYQLTRIDKDIKFTYYLPLIKIEESKYLGNVIDSPDLIE